MKVVATFLVLLLAFAAIRAQEPAPPVVDPLHRPFDEILDIYVRDGLVYYRALKSERGRFDRYVQSLADTSAETVKGWAPERQLAFWINAYNAVVLQDRDRSLPDSRPRARVSRQQHPADPRRIRAYALTVPAAARLRSMRSSATSLPALAIRARCLRWAAAPWAAGA